MIHEGAMKPVIAKHGESTETLCENNNKAIWRKAFARAKLLYRLPLYCHRDNFSLYLSRSVSRLTTVQIFKKQLIDLFAGTGSLKLA